MRPPLVLSPWVLSSYRIKFMMACFTAGKQSYFTGYEILLHELPVVAILLTQSNNNEGTMKNSKLVQNMLHTVVQVLELQNLHVVKYGINTVK